VDRVVFGRGAETRIQPHDAAPFGCQSAELIRTLASIDEHQE
jgi:hypothetical protein